MRRVTLLFVLLAVMTTAAACGGGEEEDAAALPTEAPAATVASDEEAPAPTATPAGDPDTADAEDDSEADAPAGELAALQLQCPFPFSFSYPASWEYRAEDSLGASGSNAELLFLAGDQTFHQFEIRRAEWVDAAGLAEVQGNWETNGLSPYDQVEINGEMMDVYANGKETYWVTAIPFPAGGEGDYLTIVGNAIGGTLGEATPALMLEMFGTITPNGCG